MDCFGGLKLIITIKFGQRISQWIRLKGSCYGHLTFYMSKSFFCWVQRHISYPNPRLPSPSNLANTENPGTSSALKSGYLEEYRDWKLATRKNMLHWKVATGKGYYIEKWLPEEVVTLKTGYLEKKQNLLVEMYHGKESYLLWNKHSIIVRQGC